MHYSCLGGGVIRQIVNKQLPRLPNFFSNNLPRQLIQTRQFDIALDRPLVRVAGIRYLKGQAVRIDEES